jgi:hypothetical protein
VNKYRSSNCRRPGHKLIESWVEETFGAEENLRKWEEKRRFVFVDSLLAFSYAIEGVKGGGVVDDKLSNRWSHLYARKAMGHVSLILSAVLVILLCIAVHIYANPLLVIDAWRIVTAVLIFIVLLVALLLMNSYVDKLFGEICMIELSYLTSNEEQIKEFMKNKMARKTNWYVYWDKRKNPASLSKSP